MFGFFRRKASKPAPVHALDDEQKRLIKEELERHKKGEGNIIDASIGLLHLTGDKGAYLKALLKSLEDAQLGLLVKTPQGTGNYLTLDKDGLTYLPVFTRAEHAQALMARFPEYKFVTFVNSTDLFPTVPLGVGLWINLGHPVFLYMMPPAMFTAYRALVAKQKGAAPDSGWAPEN